MNGSTQQETNTQQQTPVVLRPSVKTYAWGIPGSASSVARFAHATGALSVIDETETYAELWIGTHPSGPSHGQDGRTLSEISGGPLPFLLKVLSANKALSIQAHPDKALAERLHGSNPDKYKDDNHKPEMAVALTPFEAMCGFRRLEEISSHIRKYPEFAACISDSAKLAVFTARDEGAKTEALRAMFASFMQVDEKVASEQLNKLLNRLYANKPAHPHDEAPWERKAARAILRLAQQFPGDYTAMSPLFLNYVLIAPGESFFMAANEPHAYIAGEIVECMATSDNVVRAGLTPKFKDVDVLVNMLTYTTGGPMIDAGRPVAWDESPMFSSTQSYDTPPPVASPGLRNGGSNNGNSSGTTLRYTPPVPEFEVMLTTVNAGGMYKLPSLDCPSVLLCLNGEGSLGSNGETISRRIGPGSCLYIPPGCPAIILRAAVRLPLRVIRAHENMHLETPTHEYPYHKTPRTPPVSPAPRNRSGKNAVLGLDQLQNKEKDTQAPMMP